MMAAGAPPGGWASSALLGIYLWFAAALLADELGQAGHRYWALTLLCLSGLVVYGAAALLTFCERRWPEIQEALIGLLLVFFFLITFRAQAADDANHIVHEFFIQFG